MTLVAQTTIRYVAVALALLFLLGAACTYVSFAIYVRLTSEAVTAVSGHVAFEAGELRGIPRPVAVRRAQRLTNELARPPVTITFLDANGALLAGNAASDEHPSLTERILLRAASAFGLHARRVVLAGGVGTAVIAPDAQRLIARMEAYWRGILPAGAIVVALAVFLGRQLAKGAVRPMIDVTRSLNALGRGEFTPRAITASSTTEVRLLAEAYNRAVRDVGETFAQREQNELHMRQFIADAGHELRTPLTIIMGYVDLLESGAVPEPQLRTRVYENVRGEGKRMRRLVDKLILLARLDRPASEEAPTAIEVDAFVSRIADSFRTRLGCGRRLAVAHPSPDGKTLLVSADPTELREAIENLLDNALKYAPHSDVALRVSADEHQIAIVVEDEGPGIEPAERERIFDRFYRGTANDSEVEGSGLGLAIVKRAVERAHGTIELESDIPGGSRFTIRLPRV
jgi:signal transduction histidine kinase